MLQRSAGGTTELSRRDHGEASGGMTKVVFAVAPPPRVSNPARWGWPHWLAPVYHPGGPARSVRPVEEYL